MPRCYMCPPPTLRQEIQHDSDPERSRMLCCDISLPLRKLVLKPTAANLEAMLQKLVNHLDVINEEMKVFAKVSICVMPFPKGLFHVGSPFLAVDLVTAYYLQ